MENIEKLKELTEKLNFSMLVLEKSGGMVNIKLNDDRIAKFMNLLYLPEIAIGKIYMPKNSETLAHIHDEFELLLVSKGELELIFDKYNKILKQNEFYYIEPNTIHGAKCVTESIIIAITIPASEHWPE